MKRMLARKGFTLIELIVVILILGILAAIAVVGYTNITDRAKETAFDANVRQIVTDLSADATLAGENVVDVLPADQAAYEAEYGLGAGYVFTADVATPGSETLTITDGDHTAELDVSGAVAQRN